jgi:hypothetical protein
MVDKIPEGYVALDDLQVWQENYNSGDVGAIYAGILKFGFNNAPRVWQHNQVRGGNHSILALRMVRDNHNPVPKNVLDIDGQWYIRTVDVSHLSESEALAFAISDNRLAALASQDEDLLVKYLRQSEDEGLLEATGYDTEDVARLLTAQVLDGYTQPIVTIFDAEKGKYIIVDGFHRYYSMKANMTIAERTGGLLPIVVLDKTPAQRMAATVRHNRARGKHSIDGMAALVFKMLDNGMDDASICNELGMEAEELLRLKHITGFSKLSENTEYNRAWVSRNMIGIKLAYQAEHPDENIP